MQGWDKAYWLVVSFIDICDSHITDHIGWFACLCGTVWFWVTDCMSDHLWDLTSWWSNLVMDSEQTYKFLMPWGCTIILRTCSLLYNMIIIIVINMHKSNDNLHYIYILWRADTKSSFVVWYFTALVSVRTLRLVTEL